MQNITPMLARKDHGTPDEPRSVLPGGVIGFVCYWCALAIPFLLYGSSTLFFFLYTWPFFLALFPVSVLTGMVLNTWLRGQLLWTFLICVVAVACRFWLLFLFLSRW